MKIIETIIWYFRRGPEIPAFVWCVFAIGMCAFAFRSGFDDSLWVQAGCVICCAVTVSPIGIIIIDAVREKIKKTV